MDSSGNHQDRYGHGLAEDDGIWHQTMKVHNGGASLGIDPGTLEEASVNRGSAAVGTNYR